MNSRTGPERFDELIAIALPALVGEATGGGRLYQGAGGRLYQIVMARVELPLLRHALDLCGGNQLKAAKLLGINRNTLRKRLRRLGLGPVASRNGAPRSA